MKQFKLTLVLTMLMSMVGLQAFAYWDIEMEGLYYSLDRSNNQAQVSGFAFFELPKDLEIPADIIWEGKVFSVTSIGDNAFESCSKLTSVTIPNSVTSIGSEAFAGCKGLTSVTIPNSVTQINSYTFARCTGLTSVTIPNSVRYISGYAFSGCTGLTSVTIPNSVTSIGSEAFAGCKGLTSVTIPNSVTSIGNDSFYGCSSLTSVTLNSNALVSMSDPYYSDKMKNFFGDQVAEYIIGEDVKSIGDNAFEGCSLLSSVTIGNNVKSIGDNAFKDCSGLASITIPNSVTSIGQYAFYNCSSFQSVTFGNSLSSIGQYAFYSCSSLPSVTIPNSVSNIGDNAFGGCTDLTSVTLNCNDIASKAYTSSDNIKNIFGEQIKEYIIGDDVTSIGNNAFYNCSGLTSVTIGNSVTSIGTRAFNGCSGLTSVTIPNSVTSIGDHAFHYCTGLTSITIPNSVTSINSYAFSYCRGLTSVTIGNSVTSIGDHAFYYCKKLTSVTIPNSVTSIGERAFYDCSGLTSVTIGNSVKSIGGAAFYGCTKLTTITIPNSVTSIGEKAFCNCYLTSMIVESGNTVFDSRDNCNAIIKTASNTLVFGCRTTTIPNHVERIGESAFESCRGLTSITIPNSVSNIGDYAFQDCPGLTSVSLNSNAIVSKAYTYSDNIKNIFGNQVKEYVLGDDVTAIGDNAFYGCTGITSFTIGNNVTSIGYMTFYGCSGLTSVTIPDIVTSIGDYAFRDCSVLTSVYVNWGIPINISANVFSNRKNATLYVPTGSKEVYAAADYWGEFKEIKEKAGSHYTGDIITATTIEGIEMKFKVISPTEVEVCTETIDQDVTGSVTIPDTVGEEYHVTSIGDWAFFGCSGLTSVTIPNSVTSIGERAFAYCGLSTSAFSISIPDNVTTIGNLAFFMCSSLQSVELGSQLTSIGVGAFNLCESLKKIVCKAKTPPTCEESALYSINKLGCKLYVPKGSLSAYQTADQWKEFLLIEEINSYIAGDANGDGEVNVTDIVEIVNYIMEKPSDKFVFAAADVNEDSEINVTDIVKVVSIIMSTNNARAFGTVGNNESTIYDRLQLKTNDDHTLSLNLENETGYVASQFDLVLSSGQTLEAIALNNKRSNGHALTYSQTGTNTYRVVIHSLENQSYSDNNGELLNIAVSGRGSVTVENILFVTQGQEEKRFAPLSSQTTGINVIDQSEDLFNGDWYDLQGRKIVNPSRGHIPTGIYIVNGKKYVVK